MFHEGTLQSGIGRAIQEHKLVACFVRDDGDESSTWEDDWLQSGWVSSLLAQKAVLLRIQAESTEAGFLSAFCPISDTPILVVIQNGQLREQLVRGIEKGEFINRLRKVLGAEAIPGSGQASSTETRESARSPAIAAPVTPTPVAPVPAPAPEEHRPVNPILSPSSKAKGKQKATAAEPKSENSTTNTAQESARAALRKKKQEEKDELARIKARIEADKAERRAQAEARKIERERAAHDSPLSQTPTPASNRRSQAKDVHLNVRLFDGRTIRSSFSRTAKLQDDVRSWIDKEFAEQADNTKEKHPPYFFKQILAPLPSRELSAGEESETLGDIDLAPSATLVLIPVKGYTEAYAGGDSGIVGGVVGGVTGLVGGAFGLAYNAVGYVGSTLGSVVGYGASGTQDSEQASAGRSLGESTSESSTASNIRVRTLADQRAREPRDQEFYNGNQLNFEPNEDESNRR